MSGTTPAWFCAPGVRTQELSYLKLGRCSLHGRSWTIAGAIPEDNSEGLILVTRQ